MASNKKQYLSLLINTHQFHTTTCHFNAGLSKPGPLPTSPKGEDPINAAFSNSLKDTLPTIQLFQPRAFKS